MIVLLNDIPRNEFGCETVDRIGFLDDKTHVIHRNFDHLSFSLFTGNVDIKLCSPKHTQIIREPSCTLALPGDVRKVIPQQPVDEFYFVYNPPQIPFSLAYCKEIPRILPLSACPILTQYALLIRDLLKLNLTPLVCGQIDLLCKAMLSASFMQQYSAKYQSRQQQKILGIENALRLHFNENIDLAELAEENGMSFSSFRRLWKESHTVPPHEFVMNLRNQAACEMLKDLTLQISEVAQMTGYDDPQYFCRFFTRCNGMTPTEYRKQVRDSGNEK